MVNSMNATKIGPKYCVEYELIEGHENIGCLNINNGVYNQLDNAVFLDLDYLKKWIDKNNLKGLIIVGKGRHFSTGANVEMIKANCNNVLGIEMMLNEGKEILNYIERLPIPTVAAVKGACFGAGFEIALACRYRICTDNTYFSFPEVKLGLMPGMGGNIRLKNLIGKERALEFILSSEQIDANDAKELQIVRKVVGKDKIKEEAIQFIEKLTKEISIKQSQHIYSLLSECEKKDVEKAYELESKYFSELVKEIHVRSF